MIDAMRFTIQYRARSVDGVNGLNNNYHPI